MYHVHKNSYKTLLENKEDNTGDLWLGKSFQIWQQKHDP